MFSTTKNGENWSILSAMWLGFDDSDVLEIRKYTVFRITLWLYLGFEGWVIGCCLCAQNALPV